MDQHQERRRGHFRRGRRVPERRGADRRPPPQTPAGRDQVDVEQVMRDVRARIAQTDALELSHQQVDRLAARRLDAILDPRGVNPDLLDALRKAADDFGGQAQAASPADPPYTFEDTTLYDSHRGPLRFVRRLLHPLLKLLFNPNPLIRALHLQAEWNAASARRESERDRRQAEWNALHYRIVHRLLTEISRLSLEVEAMTLRVESLAARVDFTDRRIRTLEGASVRTPRPTEAVPAAEPAQAPETRDRDVATGDTARRRRRRRRGRRPGPPGDYTDTTAPSVEDAAPSADVGQATADSPRPHAATDMREDAPSSAEEAWTGSGAEPTGEARHDSPLETPPDVAPGRAGDDVENG